MLIFTKHAIRRCFERRISEDEIRVVLREGREYKNNEACRTLKRGTLYVVMSNDDNSVVTVFRRVSPKKVVKKKRKKARKQRIHMRHLRMK